MTKVKLKRGQVSMTGHADYDQYGRDIVCAAVSQMIFAFAEALERAEADGYAVIMRMDMEPGKVFIEYKAKDKRIKGMEDMLVAGMELLTEKYPEYVDLGGM